MTTPLTSPEELSELLTRQDRARPTVLDVRWDLGGGADVRGFAAGHVPFFGTSWLLVHGVGAALIYGLFWWRRNLPACMLTHLIVNAPVLLVTLFAA